MTKKVKISFLIIFVLALIAGAVVLTLYLNNRKDNASITVKSDMIKTEYIIGEELEITGGILDYDSGKETIQVQITKDMISNFSTEKLGSYSMIVTYKGKTTTVSYTVNEGFSLSKLYYAEDITPACWIKFDTQTSKMYFAQGTSTAPATAEEWATFGRAFNYTKSFIDRKQKIEITPVDSSSSSNASESYTIKTISSTSFTLKNVDQSINFSCVNEFDMSKTYHTDSSYGIWIKFNTQTSKMYFVQGLTTAPKNDEEWEQYATVSTFTKYYKNGKLFVSLVFINPDQSTVTGGIETISSSKISLTTDGTTIELTAVN